jgi:DNA modification methylase
LDPFCCVGATCIAAVKSSRHFIGVDINKEYLRKGYSKISAGGVKLTKSFGIKLILFRTPIKTSHDYFFSRH